MITGSIVALVTPMAADGSVDLAQLSDLLEWHIEQGTDSIAVTGTTGESATLAVSEHLQVISHSVKCIGGRIPVIAGTGANATAEAIEWTRAAKEAGADACLLVTPYYNKPTQKGLYAHYRKIADSVAIPQILYNVPGRTGCDLLPETVRALAEVDNIVALKEASGNVERAREVMALCDDDFLVYSGDDGNAMEIMLAGGKGNISVTANVAPALMHELCDLATAGNRDAAEKVNARLSGLNETLFVESNPIPVKWALKEMGLIGPGIRLPLVELDEAFQPVVKQAMQEAGVI